MTGCSSGDEWNCHASKPTCVQENQDLPPVEIHVDYGDGSGIATWSRENKQDLWRHKYAQAGTFTIVLTVIGVYDKKVQKIFNDVTVTESVLETDQVEIYCPDVIHPGEYFNCRVDIPTGKFCPRSFFEKFQFAKKLVKLKTELPE